MDRVKDGTRQFAAGGCAGLVEVSLMHPLDLVKTRLQVQRGADDATRYSGLSDCFKRIYRAEGLSGFYKGILPPILAETPKRATKFFTFEQYKRAFTSASISLPLTFSLAGMCSGLTEAVVICPFEVVKVRLQSERDVLKKQQKSTYAIARHIIAVDGFGRKGLYLGLTATFGRHGVWNMAYFGLYHSARPWLQRQDPSPGVELTGRLFLGFTAGSLASLLNIPFDVAKSRIQGPQPVQTVRKYDRCFQTIRLVFKEEGFFALYKGLLPKIMRLGPGINAQMHTIIYIRAYI